VSRVHAHASRAEIEQGQFDKLRVLLCALKDNPFYRAKIAGDHSLLEPASLAEFTERFPFTTKADLVADQSEHPPYGSDLTYPLERYTRCHGTSGSTGKPLRWLDTNDSWAWMLGNWEVVHRAAGTTAADKVFFAFSFGPFLGFWTAFESALRIGCLCLPGGGMNTVARLRSIIDHGATVLCCTPTYALHLAETAEKEGIDLCAAKIRTICVAGEPGGSVPAVREQLVRLWNGARIFDHHGMTEVGPVSFECPERPGTIHLIETSYLAEILDPDTGKPVPRGETGELLLTTLGRLGSPLLRYRTGDLVRAAVADVCVCGRHEAALEGGILGRADDMVVVRGVNVFPSAIEDVLRGFPEVAEYRVRVWLNGALREIELTVESAPGAPNDLAQRIGYALQTAFNLRIPVQMAASGSLPRFELKAKRWARED
jgi:phenylacetate-CoA ligase